MNTFRLIFGVLVVCVSCLGARLKDIATISGVRDNQLWGYGIVVGLPGTGDKDLEFTDNSLNMVLKSLGVNVLAEKIKSNNVAAVLVSATLPPFSSAGTRIDIIVSSIGSASSIENGTLLMTPLKGADGEIYAISQGTVIRPKAVNKRGQGSRRSAAVTGMIPGGALMEKDVTIDFTELRKFTLLLHSPDFTTSARAARQINQTLGAKYAMAKSAGAIEVNFPHGYTGNAVDLVAQIENIDVESDQKARVVINQHTGTVILGEHVRINPVAIAHGNLRIEVDPEKQNADQRQTDPIDSNFLGNDRQLSSRPPDNSAGAIQRVSLTDNPPLPVSPEGTSGDIDEEEEEDLEAQKKKKIEHSLKVVQGTNVADVVASLNELGATPEDLIAIIQALRSSGALLAEVQMQ